MFQKNLNWNWCNHTLVEITATKTMVFPVSKTFLSVLIKKHCLLLRLYKLAINKCAWIVCMFMEWQWHGKTEVLVKKFVLVSICPPQTPHWLIPWEWNCDLSVGMYYATSYLMLLLNFSSILYKSVMGQTLQSWARYVAHCTTYVAAVVYTTTKSSKCGAAILPSNIRCN